MSELTTCNYCDLQMYKEQARKKGMKLVTTPSPFMQGTNVFIVPKHIHLKEILTWHDCDICPPNGDVNYRRYSVAWMQVIGTQCAC